jgi:ParB family chromosome partitioning protein
MTKARGLGKGLSGLIPRGDAPASAETVAELPVELIDPNPVQPRREFAPEQLAELAASIRAQGLLQPVTVRPVGGGRYQLIAGERRLRATRDLGLPKIKAIVREVSDRQMLELALVENLLREDLNDIEVAEALLSLQNEYAYTVGQLAEVLGRSRPAVSNTLRLLELPAEVQQLIRSGALTAGHGRAVLSFPARDREEIAREASREGLSVRELERRASSRSSKPAVARSRDGGRTTSPSSSSELKQAEKRLLEHLGTKVKVSEAAGVGSITIAFHGAEDLERILDLLLEGSNPF